MNAELIIHILLAVSLLGASFCLMMAVMTINELNNVVMKLFKKIDNLTNNEKTLMTHLQEIEREKTNEKAIKEAIMKRLIAQMEERYKIHVADDNKPLDFPNGD